jgi:TetR/AcrR family transcriptional regulator, repressor of fatR-cypB operon
MSALAERQEEKREAILSAALKLFTERGFHGTAVPAVAEEAGVGAGTIYRYFESKEALVNALYRRYKSASIDYILRDFPFARSFREQFHVFWQRWAAFVAEEYAGFQFVELHHHASYLDEESRAVEERVTRLVQSLVERAQADRLVKPLPPMLLMGFVMGAFIGTVRLCRERGLELTAELLEAAEQCAWEAIRV